MPIISLDCGANTHFAARHLMLRPDQRLTGTGMMASMAPGLLLRHRGSARISDRQSVAIVGDGGFAMLMAEMTTAVQHNLPVKIIILKNNSLAEVKFEQMELGNPSFGCDLSPIDFVAFARACGADGYRCERPEEIRPAIQAALRSPRAAAGRGHCRRPTRNRPIRRNCASDSRSRSRLSKVQSVSIVFATPSSASPDSSMSAAAMRRAIHWAPSSRETSFGAFAITRSNLLKPRAWVSE